MNRQRLWRIALVAVFVLLAVAVGFGARMFILRAGPPSAAALFGGPFALVDQDGKTRTDAEFRGRYLLVYFGYTFCPDLCPTELQTISDALDRLGDKAARVQPLFITVDPARDTVPVMKEYVGHFRPGLIGLTGGAPEIAAAAKAYRVYYAKVAAADGGSDYLMDHSGFVFLMGPDGAYITHFTPQTSAQQLAKALAKFL
jgi:protein SCO1/2